MQPSANDYLGGMNAARPAARINAIASQVPGCEVDALYREWASRQIADSRERRLFQRMSDRSGIARRYTVLDETQAELGGRGFYGGEMPPGTGMRMAIYADKAPELALEAIARLPELGDITHVVLASCTGFIAPGLDQLIARRLGLASNVERISIGFMGCYAGITALRTAAHLVRSDPQARVLVVAVELCTLHLQETGNLEALLAMGQFADGAAAAIVSGRGSGLAMGEGISAELEESEELISWTIGDTGFLMHLSGEVPARIADALLDGALCDIIANGGEASEIEAWAVHPGGRSILDAVERGLDLPDDRLEASRTVLRDYGNMSSATVLFVLEKLLQQQPSSGIALAFGPGLALEGFRFGWTDDAG